MKRLLDGAQHPADNKRRAHRRVGRLAMSLRGRGGVVERPDRDGKLVSAACDELLVVWFRTGLYRPLGPMLDELSRAGRLRGPATELLERGGAFRGAEWGRFGGFIPRIVLAGAFVVGIIGVLPRRQRKADHSLRIDRRRRRRRRGDLHSLRHLRRPFKRRAQMARRWLTRRARPRASRRNRPTTRSSFPGAGRARRRGDTSPRRRQ
jgi:hypothetical protein